MWSVQYLLEHTFTAIYFYHFLLLFVAACNIRNDVSVGSKECWISFKPSCTTYFPTTVSLHFCEGICYNVNCWTFRSYPVCDAANSYVAGWPRPRLSRKSAVLDHQTGLYEIWLFLLFVLLKVIFVDRLWVIIKKPSVDCGNLSPFVCSVISNMPQPMLRQPNVGWDVWYNTMCTRQVCIIILYRDVIWCLYTVNV